MQPLLARRFTSQEGERESANYTEEESSYPESNHAASIAGVARGRERRTMSAVAPQGAALRAENSEATNNGGTYPNSSESPTR